RPIMPPVVIAVRLPAAIVVKRPFAVRIGRSADAAEPRIAPYLLAITAAAAAEGAGITHTNELPRRRVRNSTRVTELCSCRSREAEGGRQHCYQDQLWVHVAAPLRGSERSGLTVGYTGSCGLCAKRSVAALFVCRAFRAEK